MRKPGSTLTQYETVVGRAVIEELRELARRLHGKRVVMVNSTRSGGGVAEILSRMLPLLAELDIPVRWETLEGSDQFFKVTKRIHNALHGKRERVTRKMLDLFLEVSRSNAERLALDDDIVFIHDPQPIPLVEQKGKRAGSRWLWRCHIDVSRPDKDVWAFLRPFIAKFDAAVYSAPAFAQRMSMRQVLIAPSIDPLSDKNRDMDRVEIDAILRRLEIPRDLPIVTQVSRFDYLKDPMGVIEAFRRVRRTHPCRLVLAGGPATDDPEAAEVLRRVQEASKGQADIHPLMLPANSDIEINAIQRASAVVIQKSIREGFGLTVSEALWKGRPVVASAVGGIPMQVKHRYSGLLVHSVEGTAHAVKKLLSSPDYAKRLGNNGREHIRQNFLVTRHLIDYLSIFLALESSGDTIFLK